MDNVREIRLMWDEWKAMPFPSAYGGKDVAGICVTSLDTLAAGCIDTFITNNGRLDEWRTSVLKQCQGELEAVVSCLDDSAMDYFNHLLILAKRVLHLAGQ